MITFFLNSLAFIFHTNGSIQHFTQKIIVDYNCDSKHIVSKTRSTFGSFGLLID